MFKTYADAKPIDHWEPEAYYKGYKVTSLCEISVINTRMIKK